MSTVKGAHRLNKKEIWIICLGLLSVNILIDGITYQKTPPYHTIILTLLFSIGFGLILAITKKRKLLAGISSLAICFLYFLSMNFYTPLHVPYWGLFYPIVFGGIAYMDKKWELEGSKKFWLHIGGYVLVLAGIIFYEILYPSS